MQGLMRTVPYRIAADAVITVRPLSLYEPLKAKFRSIPAAFFEQRVSVYVQAADELRRHAGAQWKKASRSSADLRPLGSFRQPLL